MFCNVLVGIDGSASAMQALAQAIEMARASGSRLGLLSVATRPSLGSRISLPPFALPISPPQLAAQLQADAQRHLDKAERMVPADVPVTKLLSLSRGSVSDAVLEHTRHGPWDLIVLSNRSAADRWPLRRGVGTRLLRAASVPVLVVPNASEPAQRGRRMRTRGRLADRWALAHA
jgi:nucleotide-binding universal stress UspA family protein